MPNEPTPWFRASTNCWMVQIDRRQIRLAIGPKNETTRKAAFAKLRQILIFGEEQAQARKDPTVAEVIEHYLNHAARHLSPRTLYENTKLLQDFAEVHGFRRVNDRSCLPFHLTSWIDNHADWKSDWTIATAIKVIHRPFNWAAKQRLIAANPYRGVTHRNGEPRRPMTDREFEMLLAACQGRRFRNGASPGERFRELLIFLRLSGARPGEAIDLTWSSVDWSANVVVLTKHKTVRTQRSPRPRVIVLHPELTDLLRRIQRRKDPGEVVFQTHLGSAWHRSTVGQRIRRMRKQAGIAEDAKLYGLRHAFGTRCIKNGVDLKTTSELMGHTTTRMTEHYLHLAGEREHLAAAMILANAPRSNGETPAP